MTASESQRSDLQPRSGLDDGPPLPRPFPDGTVRRTPQESRRPTLNADRSNSEPDHSSAIHPSPVYPDPGPVDPEELEWVRLARTGNSDAFGKLVERYTKKVFNMALRSLGCFQPNHRDVESASDITQEVFLCVHRGLPDFAGDSRFSTWLHRIALNVLVTEHRKRKALKRNRRTFSLNAPLRVDKGQSDDLFIEPDTRERPPDQQVADREVWGHLHRAMAELPEDMHQVVTLRDLNGLSYEEIAEIAEVPIGTVRSRLHRARVILRTRLEGLL
jgi:RNA polymerase sigma-70 factor (ECF subfamily)